MKRCSNCGVKNEPDTKYCKNCGNELDDGIQQGLNGGTQSWEDKDSGDTGTQVWSDQEPKEEAKEFLEKGDEYRNKGKYDEAIRYYEKAANIYPDYGKVWNNKGFAYDKKGKYDEAIKCYEKAISKDPEYVLAWNNKGWAYWYNGEHDEAERCFKKSLSIDPDQPNIENKLDKLS